MTPTAREHSEHVELCRADHLSMVRPSKIPPCTAGARARMIGDQGVPVETCTRLNRNDSLSMQIE